MLPDPTNVQMTRHMVCNVVINNKFLDISPMVFRSKNPRLRNSLQVFSVFCQCKVETLKANMFGWLISLFKIDLQSVDHWKSGLEMVASLLVEGISG